MISWVFFLRESELPKHRADEAIKDFTIYSACGTSAIRLENARKEQSEFSRKIKKQKQNKTKQKNTGILLVGDSINSLSAS